MQSHVRSHVRLLLVTAIWKALFPLKDSAVELLLKEEGVSLGLDPERGMVVVVKVLLPPSLSSVGEPWP